MSVGTSRCDVEVPGPREEGPFGATSAGATGAVAGAVPGVRPATRPQPAGSRPARPEETRGSVRPAGRRSPAALPPVRPRVAGGGAHAPVAAPAVAPPAVLRRRRVAAVVVLGVLLGVLVGVLVGLVVPDAAAPTTPVPAGTSVAVVGAGESLDDVAGRVAPGADTEAVVTRIRELNGLEGSAVVPGRPLVVPGSSSLAG
ncbi:hypothetical protein Acsp06_13910 [Actinomycetospora sp. NBRC 106375]|uniref:hypothetical protein n=1 Tax=Actinomycetospora sp. NBRC 106375 TaxID=3032207 RepID=UPI0024A29AAC|nr:hypothetical protein [Actinomycetospora sp. NBRC 106375]GLZ45206.1 hypothetical protein Acsp06_13910 [Actinomycetospora sp. NBRC 106375]